MTLSGPRPDDIPLFPAANPAARRRLQEVAAQTVEMVNRWALTSPEGPEPRPAPVLAPEVLAKAIADLDPCPEEGVELGTVLGEVGETVLAHGVRPFDPRCAAHLHSPTLLTAAAAELAIGVTNQSMDSYDQAPAATLAEIRLVEWLADRLGLPSQAGGVLTAGGTASNLLGLYLAREHHARRSGRPEPRRHGLPVEAGSWRLLCSRATHFSVRQAAAVLGLGSEAVVPVDADAHDRLDPDALARVGAELGAGRTMVVVATAGTTDAGAVDPLARLAEEAHRLGAWFHVDAAVGGAFCLSERLRPRLAGIELADSVTVDLHKLWWQPIGASMLLVRDACSLVATDHPDTYLDRPEDGLPNLVGRSLDTSRRFDALKILISLRATGRRRMAAMVEHLVDTTAAVADHVEAHPHLELLSPAETVTVLFRWRPAEPVLSEPRLDEVNRAIQRDLFAAGDAVVGRTLTPDGRVALKLTVVNPRTTAEDLTALVDLVAARGAACVGEAA